ncbi:MAG: RHS repeat protein [Oscillospiraceae bacterium]|nr:RHS repeat protein [Oscillospiraceae bacterium]
MKKWNDINRPVKYTMANGGTKTIEYNIDKNYTLVTDEAGVVTKYEYDGLGRSTATAVGISIRKERLQEWKAL